MCQISVCLKVFDNGCMRIGVVGCLNAPQMVPQLLKRCSSAPRSAKAQQFCTLRQTRRSHTLHEQLDIVGGKCLCELVAARVGGRASRCGHHAQGRHRNQHQIMLRCRAAAALHTSALRLRIYTRTGDKGQSSLFSGERRSKDDAVFEALGATDELSSTLGLAREFASEANIALDEQLQEVWWKCADVVLHLLTCVCVCVWTDSVPAAGHWRQHCHPTQCIQ